MTDEPCKQKATEQELLREFAHEIRTPLTAMLGYTTFLKNTKNVAVSPEQSEDYAKRLHSSTKRLLQITERVLDEAVRGAPRVVIENVDFRVFANELMLTFEALAKERGIEFEQTIADNFPILSTDPVLLYEVMTNLISNALKFTPRGGKVIIKGDVDVNDDGIILIIQDSGKGIPPSILMRMMHGETTTHSSRYVETNGWGAGVQLVRQKTKLLGGSLEIQNAPVGGTVACIRFPAT
ncbi:MAG: HAMP domain-containing histidine kinase [Magnetovibrio sp.]|nr:HAMP domain-containing histidine kinase [Magnetovibrio sp.]